MTTSNRIKAMQTRVGNYLKGSGSSRAELRALSRELLTYVPETNDAPAICRILEDESPVIAKKLTQFFTEFVGWEFDITAERYGKKHPKQKVVDSKLKKAKEALEDEDFNFESWYAAKEAKKGNTKAPKDHAKALDKAIKAGLNAKEGETGLTKEGIVRALMANNLSLRVLLEVAKELL